MERFVIIAGNIISVIVAWAWIYYLIKEMAFN